MRKISNIFGNNPRYTKMQKPLEAAEVCDAARVIAKGHYEIISYKNGLLTLGCSSPMIAQELQSKSLDIMASINKKLGRTAVERIRFKISNYSN